MKQRLLDRVLEDAKDMQSMGFTNAYNNPEWVKLDQAASHLSLPRQVKRMENDMLKSTFNFGPVLNQQNDELSADEQ